MPFAISRLSIAAAALALVPAFAAAQNAATQSISASLQPVSFSRAGLAAAGTTPASSAAYSSSAAEAPGAVESAPQILTGKNPAPTPEDRKAALEARQSAFDSRYHIGLMTTVGVAGAGMQLGVPLSPHLAVRLGVDYFRYSGSYQYDAANISASLHSGYGRVAFDYFPWKGHRFHVSPQLVAANQLHVLATVALPSAGNFDLGGQTFYSAPGDPLHGMGRIDTGKIAPALTFGFGNMTHGHGRWTFPVEIGAMYTGTPKLQVQFTGTACVANQPPQYACQRVQDNAEFMSSLNTFRARQQHNLTYARFLPILNSGVAFRF